MCNGDNGNQHLGSLHILYQQEPTTDDERFVQVRQWLTVEGDYSDLVVEHGRTDDELATWPLKSKSYPSSSQRKKHLNGSTAGKGNSLHG